MDGMDYSVGEGLSLTGMLCERKNIATALRVHMSTLHTHIHTHTLAYTLSSVWEKGEMSPNGEDSE